MPVIDVTLAEGRSPERLRTFIERLTDAAVEALDAPRESVRVILREVPRTHFAVGGTTLAQRDAHWDNPPVADLPPEHERRA